jgi:hypothetical protein
MNYTIAAIETRYSGINFRSRLEARWAAMFDLLGWGWTYEPTDFKGWIPDFAIHGEKEIIYVEVKPVGDFPEEVANKLAASGCPGDVLIVGMLGPTWSKKYECPTIGWLGDFAVEGCFWWEPAAMSRWGGEDRIGFCHSEGTFCDRITGKYDGGGFGSNPVTQEEVTSLWREACNRTRWSPT